jgi:hypothetical protein
LVDKGYLRDRVEGRGVMAAVSDHGGGRRAPRGMAMSWGSEIATPADSG